MTSLSNTLEKEKRKLLLLFFLIFCVDIVLWVGTTIVFVCVCVCGYCFKVAVSKCVLFLMAIYVLDCFLEMQYISSFFGWFF